MKEPRRDELRPSDKNDDDDDDDNDDSIGGLGRRIRKLSSRTIEFCDSIDSIQVHWQPGFGVTDRAIADPGSIPGMFFSYKT